MQRISRREFLAVAAAGATEAAIAQSPSGGALAAPRLGAIDVHHHCFPPFALPRSGFAFERLARWTPAQSLEEMDRAGVRTAVLNTVGSAPSQGSAVEKRNHARRCNEFVAELVRTHPDRFGMFATLPMPDVEGSVVELAHAYDVLKCDGVCLMTSYEGTYLGASSYEPLLAALDERSAVVFVHPLAPACCQGVVDNVPDVFFEFPYDTGRTALSLLFNGSLRRWPRIRWILCHAGGPIPALSGRLITQSAGFAERLRLIAPQGVAYELHRLYYEIANSAYPATMAALMNLAPASQVLLGTDYPFAPLQPNIEALRNLPLQLPQDAIVRTNALQLFPRLSRSDSA